MSGVNKVILLGNLGNDPEIRYTQQGSPIANFSLATSESWTDKQTGQKQERTEWHRCVIFGKLAGIVEQYVKKGSKLYCEGQIRTRKWQDQSGADRYTTEIVVDQMQMLNRVEGENNSQGYQQSYQQQAPAQRGAPPQQGAPDFEDDIPFSNYEYRTLI